MGISRSNGEDWNGHSRSRSANVTYGRAVGMSVLFLLASALAWIAPSVGRESDDLARRATWQAPAPDDVRTEALRYVATRDPDAETQQAVDTLWPESTELPNGVRLLEHLAATVALVDDETEPLVSWCRGQPLSSVPPTFDFLTREETPEIVRNNLRLLYGRWLTQHDYLDEARAQLAGLEPADVVDPATLLFCQCVVYHGLLEKDACLAAAQRLLEDEADLPRRYAALARLVEADVRPLKKDTLDEVARMMGDIQRRLQFGRAGKRVRTEEDEVIAKLDKMIEEMEKKAKKAAKSTKAGNPSTKPAEKSMPTGQSGPGDVDQKSIGKTADWGNLPAKEREEALQQMSRDLPAHFRELIEEYFRRLARDEE